MASTDDRALDRAFDVAVVLKAVDGVIEVVGGVLLLAVPAHVLHDAIVSLTRSELSQDPHDYVARHLVRAGQSLQSSRGFGAAYLLSHGLVKVLLVVALLRGLRWAYPAMIAFLVAFIGYQGYRLAIAPSLGLWALTGFDLAVVWLVWREWVRVQARPRIRDQSP